MPASHRTKPKWSTESVASQDFGSPNRSPNLARLASLESSQQWGASGWTTRDAQEVRAGPAIGPCPHEPTDARSRIRKSPRFRISNDMNSRFLPTSGPRFARQTWRDTCSSLLSAPAIRVCDHDCGLHLLNMTRSGRRLPCSRRCGTRRERTLTAVPDAGQHAGEADGPYAPADVRRADGRVRHRPLSEPREARVDQVDEARDLSVAKRAERAVERPVGEWAWRRLRRVVWRSE